MKEWTMVHDALPEEAKNVLVYVERDSWQKNGKLKRKKCVEIGWHIGGSWNVDGCSHVVGIAWMPLPKPPKKSLYLTGGIVPFDDAIHFWESGD